MRELPRIEDACEHKCTCIKTPGGRCPSHQWRDGSHQCTHPRVGYADAFERRVAGGVEEQVSKAQDCCEGVHSVPQKSSAGQTSTNTIHNRMEWTGEEEEEKEEEEDKQEDNEMQGGEMRD